MVDKDGEFWDAAPLRSKGHAEGRARRLNRTYKSRPGDVVTNEWRVVPLYLYASPPPTGESVEEIAALLFHTFDAEEDEVGDRNWEDALPEERATCLRQAKALVARRGRG